MVYSTRENRILYTEVMYTKSDVSIYFEQLQSLTKKDLIYMFDHLPVNSAGEVCVKSISIVECAKGKWESDCIGVLCDMIEESRNLLEYVNLGFNDFTYDNIKRIVGRLLKCKNLRELYLDGNKIGEKGLVYIFKTLRGHPSIRKLSLEKCNNEDFTGEWVYHFGEFVALTPRVNVVYVNGNGNKTEDQQTAFIKYKRELLYRH
jgi:hypothetical protein